MVHDRKDSSSGYWTRVRAAHLGVLLPVLVCLSMPGSWAYAQDAPGAPSAGDSKRRQNPIDQANLPDAPSSLVTAKPRGDGKKALEDIPHPPVTLRQFPLNVAGDMYRVFTSPLYFRTRDLKWLLPVAAATGVALTQDTHVARDVVSHDPDFNRAANTVSYDLEYSYFASSPVMYAVGTLTHDERLRETGLLAGEAMADAQIFVQAVKFTSFRERPDEHNYAGSFFELSSGADSSFISGHSITAWSAAAVIAAEYPSRWKQAGVYTGATATALTRVLAEKHFPTDVLVGSVAGWMIGHYVVRAHHHFPIYRHHGGQPSF